MAQQLKVFALIMYLGLISSTHTGCLTILCNSSLREVNPLASESTFSHKIHIRYEAIGPDNSETTSEVSIY